MPMLCGLPKAVCGVFKLHSAGSSVFDVKAQALEKSEPVAQFIAVMQEPGPTCCGHLRTGLQRANAMLSAEIEARSGEARLAVMQMHLKSREAEAQTCAGSGQRP